MKSFVATAALAVLALQTTLGEARRPELSDVKGLIQSETSKRVQTCIYQGFDDQESTAGIKVLNEANGAVVPIFKTFEGKYAETGVTKRDKAGKKRVSQELILHPVKLSSGQYGFTTTEGASPEQITQFL